jgi:hypothetical protein
VSLRVSPRGPRRSMDVGWALDGSVREREGRREERAAAREDRHLARSRETQIRPRDHPPPIHDSPMTNALVSLIPRYRTDLDGR